MTKHITARIPAEVYEKLKAQAEKENRSLTKQITHILQKAVEK